MRTLISALRRMIHENAWLLITSATIGYCEPVYFCQEAVANRCRRDG